MKSYPFTGKDYAFGVCRIEPENNIHIILDAVQNESVLPLVMVGNWEYSEYGLELKRKYSDIDGIYLLDPIYNQTDLNKLRACCTMFLHGHSCGGTNPSLVEAMYLGLPIIAYDVNFNRETTEQKALYFKTAEDLNRIIKTTDKLLLKKQGECMREIAKRRYTWSRIAHLYADLF